MGETFSSPVSFVPCRFALAKPNRSTECHPHRTWWGPNPLAHNRAEDGQSRLVGGLRLPTLSPARDRSSVGTVHPAADHFLPALLLQW